jgi:hypothetical protein
MLFNFLLGAVTCVSLIGLSVAPSFSHSVSAWFGFNQGTTSLDTTQLAPVASPINQQLMADLREAESMLIAQSMSGSDLKRYAAILSGSSVVPTASSTTATGVAGAVLVGDRLVVRGDFGSLSSSLRDYATDPVNPPNPNITSAVHIHQGDATQNGPFQYALTVMLAESGLDGRFSGDYTLTSEQLQALSDGKLYVDIHTQKNRTGELRGIFQPI